MTHAITAEARRWLGTPWHHQASLRGVGTDCIGFIAGVAAACGSSEAQTFLNTPAWRSYGRAPDAALLFAMCDRLMDRIAIAAARDADVLVFEQLGVPNHPIHFAYVASGLGGPTMIHAWFVVREVVEHTLDASWRDKTLRAYRLRGVN